MPYPAGMLSVGLLLLLSAFMMMPKDVDERALQVVSYSPEMEADLKTYTNKSSYVSPVEIIARKKFTSYTLSGNDFEDGIKFKEAGAVLCKQRLKHDTIHGVHFYIGDDIKYGAFIKAAEIAKFSRIDSTHVNIFYKNNIWAFTYIPAKPKVPSKTDEYMDCGMGDDLITICCSEESYKAKREKERQFMQATINRYWPLSILWVLLLISALYNAVKASNYWFRCKM